MTLGLSPKSFIISIVTQLIFIMRNFNSNKKKCCLDKILKIPFINSTLFEMKWISFILGMH